MSYPSDNRNVSTEPASCVACDRPDSSEKMVACDGCECWFHFSCAEVDQSVSHLPWKCGSCGTMNPSQIPSRNPNDANGKKMENRLTIPVGAKKSSRASVGSKGTSRKSKKSAAEDNVSSTSSARARLALELKMLEEQNQIKEQELRADLEMRNKKLILQKQSKEKELALEAKRLSTEIAFQEKQLEEEEKSQKALLEMKRLSFETKKNIVRQFSQNGSDVSSLSNETASSEERVRRWLSKSGEQTVSDELAAKDSGNILQRCEKAAFNEIQVPVGRLNEAKAVEREEVAAPAGSGNRFASCVNLDESEPTSRQLAARQVMGKDLPSFSGNPEEWPVWISNFQRSTSTCGFSADENLIRLQRCLKGPAMEMVRCRLISPASVPHVIKVLQMRYGRPEILIRALTEKIRQLPSPKMDNLGSVVDFGIAVDSLVEHLKNAKQQAHLTNPSLLHDLVAKLPVDYRLKWATFKSSIPIVNLETFGAFMTSLVELAYEVMDDQPTTKIIKGVNQKPNERSFSHTHVDNPLVIPPPTPPSSCNDSTVSANHVKVCVACKMEGHKVANCSQFTMMNIDDRLKVVSQNELCRTCLNQHGQWPCKTWRGCGIEGCRLRHHPLLHSDTPAVPFVGSTSQLGLQKKGGVAFRILPVTLYGNNRKINVFAFLDEGSQVSLLDTAVAEELGVSGPSESLNLLWTGNITKEETNSRIIQMEISGGQSADRYKLVDVRTVESLRLPTQSLHYNDLVQSYPYLRGLQIKEYENVTPKLLIGLDNLKLTIPLAVREGDWGQPLAARCRLGWSIYGCPQTVKQTFTCGFHLRGSNDSDISFGDVTELVPRATNAKKDCTRMRTVHHKGKRNGTNFKIQDTQKDEGGLSDAVRGLTNGNPTYRTKIKELFGKPMVRLESNSMNERFNCRSATFSRHEGSEPNRGDGSGSRVGECDDEILPAVGML